MVRTADRGDVPHLDSRSGTERVPADPQPFLEKIPPDRGFRVAGGCRGTPGGDAVEIRQRFDVGFFAEAEPLMRYPARAHGRFRRPFTEHVRAGVLLGALRGWCRFPDLQLLVVGRGDPDDLREAPPARLPTHRAASASADTRSSAGAPA